MKLAIAPCCWGVEQPNHPFNPPWETVLDEAQKAGYKGLELGPYGYLPTDGGRLKAELETRGLTICAGTLYEALQGPYDTLMEKARMICHLLLQMKREESDAAGSYPPPYLVLIDKVNEIRNPYAGHPKEAPRLPKEAWKKLLNHIKDIAKMTEQEYGIRSVLHPHAGGYLEFEDELVSAMEEISPDILGLCLDTGHLHYAGMEVLKWLKIYRERLDYIHFKDINSAIYQTEIDKYTPFFDACAKGVMCPIGKGCIDYASILAYLKQSGYQGYITIEQERDPQDCGSSYTDISSSLFYLNKALKGAGGF